MAQNTTGRSIKNATNSREVFQALRAQITTKGAIVVVGDYVEGITIAQAGNFLPSGNTGKEASRCRTDKFLPTIADDVKAFMGSVLSMTLEQAQDMAYEIKDRHCVNITVWSDDVNKSKLLARRPFSGTVTERKYHSVKENVEKTEYVFTGIALDDMTSRTATLDASEFELPVEDNSNSNAEAEEAAAIAEAKAMLESKA